MYKPKILVVEDDPAISNLIRTTLETQGYQYHMAQTGSGALMEVLSYKADVVILDLGLPDMDGVDIIKKIRTWNSIPIIVVSARAEDQDKVEALDAGADDYLTKPFSIDEFLARLRAALRRSHAEKTKRRHGEEGASGAVKGQRKCDKERSESKCLRQHRQSVRCGGCASE